MSPAIKWLCYDCLLCGFCETGFHTALASCELEDAGGLICLPLSHTPLCLLAGL